MDGTGCVRSRRRRVGFLGLLALAAATPLSFGRAPEDKAEAPPPLQVMFVAERASLAEFLISPKDAALVKAVEMIPGALRDWRSRVPELQQIPEEALDLVLELATKPARIAVTNKGFDPQTGMPGIGAVVSFRMGASGEAEAKLLAEKFEKLRAEAGLPFSPTPSRRFTGMNDIPLPIGVLSYGPRQAADGWRFEYIFAAVDNPDEAFAFLPAGPEGVKPVVRGSVDLSAWTPLVSMFAGFAMMASPQGSQVMDDLRAAGVLGPDAMIVDFAHGFSAEGAANHVVFRRALKFAEHNGMSRSALSAADLAAVPADATFFTMKKVDYSVQWKRLNEQIESAGAEVNPMQQLLTALRDHSGVDIEKDVLPSLGDSTGMYFSMSTGGSSMFSGVGLVSLKDPSKMKSVLSKLGATATSVLAEQVPPPVSVEVASFERDGIGFTQLRFPGLPVPLEPTLAVAGNWLVVGATPSAARAASAHILASKSGSSVEANENFSRARWTLPGGSGPVSMMFIDSARTLNDGYASIGVVSSMVSNFVRSRTGTTPARDPGFVLPPYLELTSGVKPTLMMSSWQGDDMHIETRGDASVLVSLGALLGVGDMAPFISGAIIGGAAGAQAAEEMGNHDLDFAAEEESQGEGGEEGTEGEAEGAEPARSRRSSPY